MSDPKLHPAQQQNTDARKRLLEVIDGASSYGLPQDACDRQANRIADALEREGLLRVEPQQLAPCPFCGGEAGYYASGEAVFKVNWVGHVCHCKHCQARVSTTAGMDAAIAMWNARALTALTFTSAAGTETREACKADFYALWCDECNTHPSKCPRRPHSPAGKEPLPDWKQDQADTSVMPRKPLPAESVTEKEISDCLWASVLSLSDNQARNIARAILAKYEVRRRA